MFRFLWTETGATIQNKSITFVLLKCGGLCPIFATRWQHRSCMFFTCVTPGVTDSRVTSVLIVMATILFFLNQVNTGKMRISVTLFVFLPCTRFKLLSTTTLIMNYYDLIMHLGFLLTQSTGIKQTFKKKKKVKNWIQMCRSCQRLKCVKKKKICSLSSFSNLFEMIISCLWFSWRLVLVSAGPVF